MVGVTAFKDWLGRFTALGHRKTSLAAQQGSWNRAMWQSSEAGEHFSNKTDHS